LTAARPFPGCIFGGGFVKDSVVEPEIGSGQRTGLEEPKSGFGRAAHWDYTFAFWALRLWLGVRALFVGIQKFAAYKSVAMPLIDPSTGQPDASGVMVNVSVKSYALANYAGIPAGLRDKFAHEPLFPKFALVLFDRMLGPAFILTGIMLIVGLGTRLSLLAQGLLFIALTVGLVLIDQNDGVAWLGIHIGLVAAAFLLVRHNRFAVLKRW
jgi:thiosulfate dehydrogenase [quinone] large subunit